MFETDRLVLRKFVNSDMQALYQLLQDEEVNVFLPWFPVKNVEETKEFWHRGIVTEAGKALIAQLKQDGIPYITATHDRNNPRSGGVMRQLGMKYCYSYEEQWQPKNILVTFRMFQLNLDGQEGRIYPKYWNLYDTHFVEKNI